MNVEISLFGPMRKYGANVRCELRAGGTVAELRAALLDALRAAHPFSDEALLQHCVFATETEVVFDDALVQQNTIYAVLPPVCGG